MHPHIQHPLLKQPNLLRTHNADFLQCPSKEFLPCSLAPKQFAWCNDTCFIEELTDYLGIEAKSQGLGAVVAGRA